MNLNELTALFTIASAVLIDAPLPIVEVKTIANYEVTPAGFASAKHIQFAEAAVTTMMTNTNRIETTDVTL